ncbi:hypothetical protein TEHAL1_18800 [Tetragenococcus halophilus]|nr:hypothetical protein TEHAB4_18750 [Tetragenococcus halophilus]GMG64405.1 hypothetical protein TEHAL1_18800 [Tetragenococcus halophilus]GMG65098.1 hypothetical protein TEHIT2_02890 [Tetragenococcus halophilus]GMG68582.1 hypothetical protein TEHMS4_15180 [Tetragenococcus halophilus]GMG71219.1 hypothetical protein TEHOK1_19080 [Tetragenococcus halophilus]
MHFLNEKLTQFDQILDGKTADELNPIYWTNKKEQFIKERLEEKQ